MQTRKHRAETHLSSTLAHQLGFLDFGGGDGIDSTMICFCFAAWFERTTAVLRPAGGNKAKYSVIAN